MHFLDQRCSSSAPGWGTGDLWGRSFTHQGQQLSKILPETVDNSEHFSVPAVRGAKDNLSLLLLRCSRKDTSAAVNILVWSKRKLLLQGSKTQSALWRHILASYSHVWGPMAVQFNPIQPLAATWVLFQLWQCLDLFMDSDIEGL